MPSSRPVVALIAALAEAGFVLVVPQEDLFNAWRMVIRSAPGARDVAAAAKGLAGSAIAAAMGIGWRMPGWHILVEPSGYVLDLREEGLATVATAATEAFAQLSAEKLVDGDETRRATRAWRVIRRHYGHGHQPLGWRRDPFPR